LSSPTVSTKLARIAEQSKRDATWVFTTLAHLMDEDFLTEAFYQLRKDAAAGIDEMIVTEYAVNLGERIADLHRRMVAWEYRAQPARRVWIPKPIFDSLRICASDNQQLTKAQDGLGTTFRTPWVLGSCLLP
jgi:hypothetical protein